MPIQHKLVDMATKIDASRLLTYRAATMLDAGKRVTRESAMAKLFSSEAAVWIANEAVQIHGGYGFIWRLVPSRSSIATSNSAPSAKAPATCSAFRSPASFKD